MAVAALERAIAAAGGGEQGRAAVADRVAYTWFNRIIALRFMDANGYTGIGVVSPQPGVHGGQPEILAEAKRGTVDTAIVGAKTRQVVTGLLDGTRRSSDPQGEAYALILADYCRHWNRAMPFMFEREGDFTELLIPANLLADDSVITRAVDVLTPEVCEDVEVIGWLYQFYIAERKDEVFAGFKQNKKAGAAEIPAATQLFTPHWIVRYLVENSLGRLWMLNRPSSRLIDRMDYYIAPIDEETDFLKISGPEELTVIDPACGSGHMLTYAFDLLYAIYEEEGYAPLDIPGLILSHNLYGIEIDPRAGALAALALTMKARATQRSFFNRQVVPNVCGLESVRFSSQELDFLLTDGGDRFAESTFWNQFEHADTFGSLIQPDPELAARLRQHLKRLDDGGDILNANTIARAERVVLQADYLVAAYSVVVANPPYMGSRNAVDLLSKHLKSEYAGFHADLFSAFIARSTGLAARGGRIGIMSPNVWLYIASHLAVRKLMTGRLSLRGLVELPLSGFKGATVQICAFVGAIDGSSRPVTFVRLVDDSGNEDDLRSLLIQSLRDRDADGRYYETTLTKFDALPNSAFAYWLSEPMLQSFEHGRPLETIGEPRQGMATSDNGRFTRLWFEVSRDRFGPDMDRESAAKSGRRWFPYNKGGDFRKWYGNQQFVVNWEHDGAEVLGFAASKYGSPTRTIKNIKYYFQPSVSWSKIGTGMPAFRYFPRGFLFDVAGTSIFGAEAELVALAAMCNSNVAREMLAATSPTLNLEVGTLAQLPIVELPARTSEIVRELIEMHRDDWNQSELSWDFQDLGLLRAREPRVIRAVLSAFETGQSLADCARLLEIELNTEVAQLYGLEDEVEADVPIARITLNANPAFRYATGKTGEDELARRFAEDQVSELVSYAVGCMFGRYSLDKMGLILADQGATLQDFLAEVPSPSFMPDRDNVIPVVDGDWFEDDIVARFRTFLRAAFGEQHFEENLRLVTESLGVKDIRDYFVKSFYKDHVQRYKKRPIYWLFSSPKGSFNALIYMHRYTPSTVSTVLNEYLREFGAKLAASLAQQERLAAGGGTPRQQAAAQKEADRLRKVLLELAEYEHDVLYPLASRQLAIDLDEGVKANYPKFGSALKKIPGLEAGDD